jgi:beta-glucosidase
MALQGFARIHLAPGEQREVAFTVTPEQLRMLDADMQWVVEPGEFRVLVGGSSRDIRLRGTFMVEGQ